MKHRLVTLVAIAGFVALGGVSACGDEEACQVLGENCSATYKQAHNITYACCGGLSCETGASGVPTCQ